MDKGITPVIAVILLLLITISLVGFAFVFLGRTTETAAESGEQQLEQQISQINARFAIENVGGDKVYLRNLGTEAIPSNSLAVYVNDKKVDYTLASDIGSNEVGEIVVIPKSCKDFLEGGDIRITAGAISDSANVGDLSRGDGVYKIKPGTQIIDVYCDMTTDDGGWTLVMKIDGTKTTFSWSSTHWTTNSVYNPTSPGFDTTEAKLDSFNNVPFNEIRLGMRHPSNGELRWLKLSATANSLYSLLSSGNHVATSIGRNAWKSLLYDASLQPNCNLEGFNVQCGGDTKARIGITSNQENDCGSCDSRIGFGTSGSYCVQDTSNSAGNEARCGSDNGDKSTKVFGYIFVR